MGDETIGFLLFRFFVESMSVTEPAIFPELQLLWCITLVFCCGIISSFALTACKRYNFSHEISSSKLEIKFLFYSKTSEITPAPTVLPPSRIANRNSFSMAIGVISSATSSTLSPGITISTPSGRVADPVTSVVLK